MSLRGTLVEHSDSLLRALRAEADADIHVLNNVKYKPPDISLFLFLHHLPVSISGNPAVHRYRHGFDIEN